MRYKKNVENIRVAEHVFFFTVHNKHTVCQIEAYITTKGSLENIGKNMLAYLK